MGEAFEFDSKIAKISQEGEEVLLYLDEVDKPRKYNSGNYVGELQSLLNKSESYHFTVIPLKDKPEFVIESISLSTKPDKILFKRLNETISDSLGELTQTLQGDFEEKRLKEYEDIKHMYSELSMNQEVQQIRSKLDIDMSGYDNIDKLCVLLYCKSINQAIKKAHQNNNKEKMIAYNLYSSLGVFGKSFIKPYQEFISDIRLYSAIK